ncbi:MAG TPA: sodium:proton antiporter [Chitinophagales bacterium]|nr:sodium:proton antiporter [Chitinophagales bacterium]
MTTYTLFSIIIVLTALFAYVNERLIKLPPAIGLMLLAIISSAILIVSGSLYPPLLEEIKSVLLQFDFSDLLLGSMLSFMLFAGAIHIDVGELNQEKWAVMVFSTISVVLSTFMIGTFFFYLLPLFDIQVSYIHCLLFGSVVSPTDPIAVMGILREAKIPRSLETKISGESLFNDGVAVVVFITISQTAEQPGGLQWLDVAKLFAWEALGGICLGLTVGYIGLLLMRRIENYKVEVLLTLAIVMGGYSLASLLHTSGPLAMVAAGILVGNEGRAHSMSSIAAEYIDKFWELIDEVLNAILFVLIGLELLVIHFHATFIALGLIAIVATLVIRYISILLPAQVIKFRERITHRTIFILTWGGLRGGLSIAMALSLKPETHKELWVAITYFIVAFSILVQGLTVGKLAKKLK